MVHGSVGRLGASTVCSIFLARSELLCITALVLPHATDAVVYMALFDYMYCVIKESSVSLSSVSLRRVPHTNGYNTYCKNSGNCIFTFSKLSFFYEITFNISNTCVKKSNSHKIKKSLHI